MGKASLTDFAEQHPRQKTGYTAWIETIPEWPEVLKGWQSGISQSQIQKWLINECGYQPTQATRTRIAHLSKKYPRTTDG